VAAYIIVSSRITDPAGLDEYLAVVGSTLAGHDVEVLVSDDEATVLEGEPPGRRAVVLQFPDRDAALSWYHSDAYQAVIGMRLASTEGHMVLVDGRS
jgi:uncharacterized protein (DUF1330 family)